MPRRYSAGQIPFLPAEGDVAYLYCGANVTAVGTIGSGSDVSVQRMLSVIGTPLLCLDEVLKRSVSRYIEGKQLMEAPDGFEEVVFDGLEIFIY